MADDRFDDLVRDLTALGGAVDPPVPSNLATDVMVRVAALPPPDQAGNRWTRMLLRPARRVAESVASFGSRRRIAVVVAALCVALLATPPVRATVADWFGFGGVVVERGTPEEGEAPPPPAVQQDKSLSAAADDVGFTVWAPAALGVPDGVEVAGDRRAVSMSWSTDDGVVRLDQFDARLDFYAVKRATDVHYASVGGTDALWFEEPHDVVLLEPDGSRRTESARLAGHTLIWLDGTTTLRLEGQLSLDRAVEIAQSAVPVM